MAKPVFTIDGNKVLRDGVLVATARNAKVAAQQARQMAGTQGGVFSTTTTPTAPTAPKTQSSGNLQFYRIGSDIFEAGTNRKLGPTEWNRDWSGKAKEVQAPADTTKTSPSPTTPTSPTASRPQFYRVGADIFEAGTNRKIGPTEWNRDWSGKATEVQAPAGAVDDTEVDMSGLSQDEIDAAKALADKALESDLVYKPKITPEDIKTYIAEGIASATEETDPYYKEVLSRATEAYVQGVTFEAQARELQLQQQKINEARELKAVQDNLEARGATFSGEAVQLLGDMSALPPDLRENVQGLLQQQQSLTASTTQQRFAENVQRLSSAAEAQIGTAGIEQAQGKLPTLAEGLARGLGTPTKGTIAAEQVTGQQTRGRELAKGRVAQELLMSPDFPINSDALNLLI